MGLFGFDAQRAITMSLQQLFFAGLLELEIIYYTISNSSTSKMRVDLGGMVPGIPRSP